jgi:16S rRNA (uracil1498-N3)-methyltransferase
MSKHVPRIHCAQSLSAQSTQRMEGDTAHHLLNVLRLKPGASLILFDGTGGEYQGTLRAAGKSWVEVEAGSHRDLHSESTLQILLAQAISRGERMDYTVQKAVELGVQQIQPLETERSQARMDATRQAKKLRHWQDIARSAAEQSGRECVPAVLPVCSLGDWLRQLPPCGLKLLLEPQAPRHLKSLPASEQICLLSGPEGGLSDTETAAAIDSGFTAIQLGPRILRTETAAVACLAALQFQWGDLAG